MASLEPIANVPETRAAEPTRVSAVAADDGPVAQAAAKLRAERDEQRKTERLPANLVVRLDVDAARFVQTLTDASTEETVLKYPSESQLAFSRAVMAYLRARIES
jgi:hypothetical protein